jgi:hypothetical protein
MGSAFRTHGEKRIAHKIFVGNPQERDLDVGWRILKLTLESEDGGGTDWIHLAHDRDRWRALVNTVMNLRVP